MSMRGSFTLFGVIVLALTTPVARAADVSVVVDVSGTMGRYGAWQVDTVTLLERVLAGDSLADVRFSSTGDREAALRFRLGAGECIYLLRFGSVQTDAFPFFTPAQRAGSVSELRGLFPYRLEQYKESRTNKPLAAAVAARIMGGPMARLIVISDFLVDADLTQQQQQYVNEFESQAKIETPLIFNWTGGNRVSVKLIEVAIPSTKPRPDAPPPPPVSVHQIQILEARSIEGSPARTQFRWRVTPPGAIRAFRLTLRNVKDGRTVRDQGGLAVPSVAVATPDPGDYRVVVTGDFEDGTQAISPPYPLKVEGNSLAVLWGLLGVGAAGTAFWWLSRQASQRSAAKAGGRKQDEED
ncbi:MAG: hypothetical protein ABI693_19645 [Bryobacteraceae bacterium]